MGKGWWRLSAAVVALCVVAAPTPPARATVAGEPAGMFGAMQRDLKLTADQARARLDREDAAGASERALVAELGDAVAGSWLGPDQRLVVAITDAGLVARVRAAGAEPRVVTRGAAQLGQIQAKLDAAGTPPAAVSSWYVDAASNSVVVTAQPDRLATATEFVRRAGVDPAAVRVQPSTLRPVAQHDVLGADPYHKDAIPDPEQFLPTCSVGFTIVGGYVTAGHCGGTNTATYGNVVVDGERVRLGTVRARVVGAGDYAWVETTGWTLEPLVQLDDGGVVLVLGSQVAPLNSAVCRSGAVSGTRCGTITARNVTVNFGWGTVSGLTRTTACSKNGDSGGPFMWGSQAQGVLSGGQLGCPANGDLGESFFQPVNPILVKYRLTLRTVAGGGVPPTITHFSCENFGDGQFGCGVGSWPVVSTLRWKVNDNPRSEWNNEKSVVGSCADGERVSVDVTVSNAWGSHSRSTSVRCTLQ